MHVTKKDLKDTLYRLCTSECLTPLEIEYLEVELSMGRFPKDEFTGHIRTAVVDGEVVYLIRHTWKGFEEKWRYTDVRLFIPSLAAFGFSVSHTPCEGYPIQERFYSVFMGYENIPFSVDKEDISPRKKVTQEEKEALTRVRVRMAEQNKKG
jgi:hypothetical protein